MLKHNYEEFGYRDKAYKKYLAKRKLVLELNKANRARWNACIQELKKHENLEEGYENKLLLKRK